MNEVLFYEDNKKLKKVVLVVAIILSVCLAGWLLAFVLSFIIPLPAELATLPKATTGDIVEVVVYLSIIAIITGLLYIYRFKGKSCKYYLSISGREITVNSASGINKYETKSLREYEVVENGKNFARILLRFKENKKILVSTYKLAELKTILEYLLLANKKPTGAS